MEPGSDMETRSMMRWQKKTGDGQRNPKFCRNKLSSPALYSVQVLGWVLRYHGEEETPPSGSDLSLKRLAAWKMRFGSGPIDWSKPRFQLPALQLQVHYGRKLPFLRQLVSFSQRKLSLQEEDLRMAMSMAGVPHAKIRGKGRLRRKTSWCLEMDLHENIIPNFLTGVVKH